MALDDLYTQPQTGPRLLERGKDNLVTCEVRYPAGDVVAPSAGTYTLFDPGGVVVVNAAAVTITDRVATYTVPAALLPTSRLFEDRWQERWALTIAGVVYDFDRDAALVSRRIYPTLTDDMVVGGSALLRRIMAKRGTTRFQAEREEAWTEILQWVMEQERWPSLILNQWVFQRPHKWLTRRMIYANGRTDLPEGNFEDLASEAHNLAEKHLSEIRLVYDETGDGLRSDAIDGTQKMGQTLMLGAYHNRNHSPTTTGGGLW